MIPLAEELQSKIAEIRNSSGAPAVSHSDKDFQRKPMENIHGRGLSSGFINQSSAPDVPKLGEGPPLLQGIIRNGEKYLDMMIQGTKVGLIIGKGGETIRGLQERAGVKVTIHQQVNDASEPEKQLRIIGDPEKVDRCKEMIHDLLIEKEMERANRAGGQGMGFQRDRPNDRFNEYGSSERPQFGQDRPRHEMSRQGVGFMGGGKEVAVPPNFIGLVIGKGGESIKRIQQESGCKIQFDTTKSDAHGNKICSISGPPDSVHRAQQLIQEIIDNAASNRGNQNRFMGGEETRYPVPANRCGAVIGRGGETIRVIKQQSGCDIELDKMSKNQGGDEKVFIIRGPPERIPLAQQLIDEKVRGGNSSPQRNQETSQGGFGSQSGDYSFNNYIQAQHGIPPVNLNDGE
jgi:far upstream element-binding protein